MTTIAHLSDVHALSLRGASPLSFLSLKRLGGAANLLLNRRNKHPVALFESLIDDLNRSPLDAVVVTGDLVNLSLVSEFALARRLLDRIALGPSRVTLIPGNHDVYTWTAERARSFERHFAPYLRSDDGSERAVRSEDGSGREVESAPAEAVDAPAGPLPYPVVRVQGEVAIIGVSSARPSPVPFADGRVGPDQLRAVEEALRRHAGRFRLVLIHHPPLRNRHAFLRGLRDRDALQAVLARAGAELVLHGHEHRDLRQELPGPGGPIPVLGVGSATFDDPRPARRARYHVIRIDGARFTVETRVHDPARGGFAPSRQ